MARDRRPCGTDTMDNKDRTIVTFGGDDTEQKVNSYDVSIDVDTATDVTPETKPYETPASGEPADEYLDDFRTSVDRYEAENQAGREHAAQTDAEYIDERNQSTVSESSEDSYAPDSSYSPAEAPASVRRIPARDPRYVTKGTLAICMVITMLVSSILGALIGGVISGNNPSTSSGNKTAQTEDSGLSQKSISDATGSELTVTQIVNKNADAVVEILVSGSAQNFFGQMQPTEGAGSGVIVRKDGYIVTNYHVIQGANKVQVTLHNGETYPAAIVGGDNTNDIAIIKINADNLTVAELGDSSTVSVGDTAVAIGNPLGQLGGTATTGIISALDRNLEIEGRTLTLMQTDAAINGGNSGGGLFNSKGQLIGIVDAKSSGVGIEGLAFAIPINAVADTINDIIENGTISSRPAVGIRIADVSEETAQYYQLESAGVYISQVTGENAQKAGFQPEDRIVSIDGKAIESSQQFISIVKGHKAGDIVSIVVNRGGQEIEIKTELEEYTSAE